MGVHKRTKAKCNVEFYKSAFLAKADSDDSADVVHIQINFGNVDKIRPVVVFSRGLNLVPTLDQGSVWRGGVKRYRRREERGEGHRQWRRVERSGDNPNP